MANRSARERWVWVAVYALIALAFWGVRPLWESTEARYAEVSRGMVSSGDWLIPRIEGREHLTKPPLAYWVFAAGIGVLGANDWGARFGQSVVFFGAMCAVAALARGWGASRREAGIAGLIFGTGVVPFAAGHYLTTDMTLALFEVLFVVGVWRVWGGGREKGEGIREKGSGVGVEGSSEASSPHSAAADLRPALSREARERRDEHATLKRRGVARGSGVWRWVCWIALGLAFETKGPPGLLPLVAVVVFAAQERWLARRGCATALRPARRMWSVGAVVACVVISVAWFVAVAARTPGALDYFLKGEILDRIFRASGGAEGMRGAVHPRHNGAWIYPAALIGGVFPWVFLWPQLVGRTVERVRAGWRGLGAEERFTVVWFVVALAALCAASSRMPLYALPLFAPLSVWGARVFVSRVEAEMRGVRWIRWSVRGMWAVAGVVMVGFTLAPDAVAWPGWLKGAAPKMVEGAPPSYRGFARGVEALRKGAGAERVVVVGEAERPLSLDFYLNRTLSRVASVEAAQTDERPVIVLERGSAEAMTSGGITRYGWSARAVGGRSGR